MTAHDTPTAATEAGALLGAVLIVPLNRLKASPRNARKTTHASATLEALAASIKAKGVLQPPVVEIERRDDGTPTGAYLVTIGEGRRLALRLLAKRKAIKATHPVRVTVDETHDAHEISLDEKRGSRQMQSGRKERSPDVSFAADIQCPLMAQGSLSCMCGQSILIASRRLD